MDYDLQPVDTLVDEIKGTTGYISSIFTPRVNLAFAVLVVGAILVFTVFN